jgi:drug/metabolite transporter (DMT)-like permease
VSGPLCVAQSQPSSIRPLPSPSGTTTLRVLTAVESSILNSLMLPQIAILAVVFLGEKLAGKEIIGLLLVGIGGIVVQLKQKR